MILRYQSSGLIEAARSGLDPEVGHVCLRIVVGVASSPMLPGDARISGNAIMLATLRPKSETGPVRIITHL